MTHPEILDLFSGAAGGWSLGMHRAGFETIAACELDPWRRATFSQNFPGAILYDDVRTLTAGRIVSDCGNLPSVIVGSPPCQDASAANSKGKGVEGDQTGLFFEAIRLVAECRPRWCAFENSPFLRTRGYDRIAGELEAIDYACEPFVVAASDLGAPHGRKRVWIIASDTSQAEPVGWPAPGGRQRRPEEITADDGLSASEQVGRAGLSWAKDWDQWQGGIARHLRVDDGLSAAVSRECISAYGDAILPQISEAIGRTILGVEAARRFLFSLSPTERADG
jgi:DNA (cytosine-5)-methyltransferase 1